MQMFGTRQVGFLLGEVRRGLLRNQANSSFQEHDCHHKCSSGSIFDENCLSLTSTRQQKASRHDCHKNCWSRNFVDETCLSAADGSITGYTHGLTLATCTLLFHCMQMIYHWAYTCLYDKFSVTKSTLSSKRTREMRTDTFGTDSPMQLLQMLVILSNVWNS